MTFEIDAALLAHAAIVGAACGLKESATPIAVAITPDRVAELVRAGMEATAAAMEARKASRADKAGEGSK
ncbi:MAG TPA: hypothetical protein VGI93_19945 [Steroidobacteraceae bacterium]|jgi:hypothetical protein